MTRLAANSATYEFALIDKRTGLPTEHRFGYPSVTTILKSVLARPALERWMYRQTVESVEHLLEFYEGTLPTARQLHAMNDHDLDGLLAENGLRPPDIRDAAARRGSNAHDFLEALALDNVARITYGDEPTWERKCCPGIAGPYDGYCEGVSRWFRETDLEVLGAERPVWSHAQGFAGTFDLLWRDLGSRSKRVVLTDLKTHAPLERRRGSDEGPAYLSDRIQIQAYRSAYAEMTGRAPDRGLVLMVDAEGGYTEDYRDAPGGAWAAILTVYATLAGSVTR